MEPLEGYHKVLLIQEQYIDHVFHLSTTPLLPHITGLLLPSKLSTTFAQCFLC